MKVAVIGAGPSGIISALTINKKNQVFLIDSNDKVGKKILITGAGHCNYWNSLIDISKYQTDDYRNLEKIITKNNQDVVLSYLDSLGIYPRIKNSYYYPYSNQATSVRQILENSLNKNNINLLLNTKVLSINKTNNSFRIITDKQELLVDKVIIATGSKAYPKTGSDGSGYTIAKTLGHKINPVLPALTKLITNDDSIKDWENVRCDSIVKLFIDGKLSKEEFGEIQLTKDGISGICTFNISSLASKALYQKNKVEVLIDFLPNIDGYSFLEDRSKKLNNQTIEKILESIFNYKLLFLLLKKANIKREDMWDKLTNEEKNRLVATIKNFKLLITGTESFDKSQVCTGGVSLKEINPNTMESIIIPNLYLCGEILDVDGECGGYNLSFAFISGYLAGSGIND